MEKQSKHILKIWCAVVVATVWCIYALYNSRHENQMVLLETTQKLFQQAYKDETNRRILECGDDFVFSYQGASIFEKDSITIEQVDTIICIKNDKEKAHRMPPEEKQDFSLQLCLALKYPLQVTVLNEAFQDSLRQHSIPAQTVMRYTFMEKTECSASDSLFDSSFIPLKEIAFGPCRTIILEAFVQIPPTYIMGKTLRANLFPLIVLLALWTTAVVLTWKKSRTHSPEQASSPENTEEASPLWFDKIHGVLHYHEIQIKLGNQRLKLFLLLLEHKGHFIEADYLRETIWPDGSVSKDALSTTVKRLKSDLSPIPEITIESARSKGYMLNGPLFLR